MGFKEKIKSLSNGIRKHQKANNTEKRYITSLLRVLGYETDNPSEVRVDLVVNTNDWCKYKVDYAILRHDTPLLIVKYKQKKNSLKTTKLQLACCFNETGARFGVLTDGIKYRFYIDSDTPFKMDKNPFFEFDLRSIGDSQIEELWKFHKTWFCRNPWRVLAEARKSMFESKIRRIILNEIDSPKCWFLYELVDSFREQGTPPKTTLKEIFAQIIDEKITQLLQEKITDMIANE
jgi:hypothetical protein